jgi:hypothetical protein
MCVHIAEVWLSAAVGTIRIVCLLCLWSRLLCWLLRRWVVAVGVWVSVVVAVVVAGVAVVVVVMAA